jgi:hypothetical protein
MAKWMSSRRIAFSDTIFLCLPKRKQSFCYESPHVPVSLQTPILQHPILIRHLINSRKLQNIKVRRNAAEQNEKK